MLPTPLAVQICDRWHFMKNLGDVVEAYLVRARVRISDSSPQSEAAKEDLPSQEAEIAPLKLF